MSTRGGGISDEPAIRWRGKIQPIVLERARVVDLGARRFGKVARLADAQAKAHAYLPPRSEAFRDELRMLWIAAGFTRPSRRLRGALSVHVWFSGSGRRGDLDNYVKAVLDAANGQLWEDDAQVEMLVAGFEAWGPGVSPAVNLAVYRLPPAA